MGVKLPFYVNIVVWIMYPKGVIPSSTTASLKLIVVCAFPHMSSWVKFITRSIINFTSWTQLRVHDSGFAIHESLLRWVNALYVRLRVRTQCALHAVKRRMLSLTLRSRVSCMDRNSGWSGVWKLAPLRCEAILVIACPHKSQNTTDTQDSERHF